MNSIKRFKNLMSILLLYAANIIVPEKTPITAQFTVTEAGRLLTGRKFMRLTTSEK